MSDKLPLILAAGAAIVLLGGKKSKKKAGSSSAKVEPMPGPDPGQPPLPPSEEAPPAPDMPDVGSSGESVGPERVASGIRKDRRGHFAWRIVRDADSYLAQELISNHRLSPVQAEIGVSDSENGARAILRDYYNESLIKRYPNEKPKDDPHGMLKLGSIKSVNFNR